MSPFLDPKKRGRPAPVSVRIPDDTLKKIAATARESKTTRHDAILQLLRMALDLPPAVMDRVDRVAKQRNHERNEMIVQLLEYALDAHEGKKPKK